MSFPLRYATASQEVPLGPFLDSVNGDDEESGLTIANTDIKLWKSGATSMVSKNSGGATYMTKGMYYAVLDATDTNTVGAMDIVVHAAGALAVRLHCIVHPAQVYDSLIAGTDVLDVNNVSGTGGDQCTIQILVNATPVPSATVWMTTDAAGATVVAGPLITDSSGEVTFLLDAGTTYYLWMRKDGYAPILGTAYVAVAD